MPRLSKRETQHLLKKTLPVTTFIEADGHMSTKPEIVELYRSGQSKFETLEVKDRKVRVYSSSAVVISELSMKGHSGPAELNGTYRSTRVLEGKNGRWQSVSFQLTKVQ